MDINSIMPMSGQLLGEDGKTANIVDLLGAGSPVSGAVHDINVYSPRSGRVIGEDGKVYNLVDLLGGFGGGASVRIEVTDDDALTIYRNGKPTLIGAANLDTGVFAVGKDYRVYLDGEAVTISLAADLPLRKIGGFHYGINRRVNSALQPVNTAGTERGTDWEANIYSGIVPRSVWTDSHRPKCDPAGMVYLSGGVWADIYIASDDGTGGLLTRHNALPVTGINWYAFTEKLMLSGKRLLTYSEWIQAALGSPQGLAGNTTNAWSAGTDKQVTGFVERAVSSIGCRDCSGNVWEFVADVIATGSGTDGWQNPMPGYGQTWTFGDFRILIAGGSYFNGALCGARTVCTTNSPWSSHASCGARGACGSI